MLTTGPIEFSISEKLHINLGRVLDYLFINVILFYDFINFFAGLRFLRHLFGFSRIQYYIVGASC